MIAETAPSLLDALFDYGPLVYAAIVVPLLVLLIAGMVLEIRRDGRRS